MDRPKDPAFPRRSHFTIILSPPSPVDLAQLLARGAFFFPVLDPLGSGDNLGLGYNQLAEEKPSAYTHAGRPKIHIWKLSDGARTFDSTKVLFTLFSAFRLRLFGRG